MLETNTEKGLAGLLFLAVLFLLYVLVYAPQPTAEGYCTNDCTTSVKYSNDPYVNSQLICGCENGIVNVEQNYDTAFAQYAFKVNCKCCSCVGSGALALPDCAEMGILGYIYGLFGMCEW